MAAVPISRIDFPSGLIALKSTSKPGFIRRMRRRMSSKMMTEGSGGRIGEVVVKDGTVVGARRWFL